MKVKVEKNDESPSKSSKTPRRIEESSSHKDLQASTSKSTTFQDDKKRKKSVVKEISSCLHKLTFGCAFQIVITVNANSGDVANSSKAS